MAGFEIKWGPLTRAVNGDPMVASQKLMEAIGQAMKGQTIRRFKQGVDPDGQAWAPSSRAGGMKKGKTLVDTGRLRDSISFSATPTEVHVGSNVVYAHIHQLAGDAGRGRKVTLPARPYLGVNDDDAEEIQSLVAEHMRRLFGAT